jgi:hypothetical protein
MVKNRENSNKFNVQKVKKSIENFLIALKRFLKIHRLHS